VAESRIEELRRRAGRDPGSRLFAQLAEEERKAGNLSEAVRVARAGLAVHPAYPAALLTLGRALIDSGDAPGARAALQEALKQAPDNILASRFLGQALEASGDLAGALRQYRATLRLAPGDRQLAERVQALEQGGAGARPSTGMPAAERRAEEGGAREERATPSLSAGPAAALAAVEERPPLRARSREGAGQLPSEEAPEGGTPPFSSPTLAELYLRQGLVERALEVYRKVVAERPSDGKARTRLAELVSQLAVEPGGSAGDPQEARRRALQRTIAGLEVLLGMARRR
jgi:Flp pilus assembly protein TadD